MNIKGWIFSLSIVLSVPAHSRAVAGESEFVISKKTHEEHKKVKKSQAKLKEELAYSAERAMKLSLECVTLLAEYQLQRADTVARDTVLLSRLAECQRTLAALVSHLIDGVDDLAHKESATSFGKATKKQLSCLCIVCHETEALLTTIADELKRIQREHALPKKDAVPQLIDTATLSTWQTAIAHKAQQLR